MLAPRAAHGHGYITPALTAEIVPEELDEIVDTIQELHAFRGSHDVVPYPPVAAVEFAQLVNQ
jgi:hypothetical protein